MSTIETLPVECELGECPVWHPDEERFFFTDIERGLLYRANPENLQVEVCYEGPKVGGLTLQEDGSFVLFRDRGNVVVWRRGEVLATVVEEIEEVVAVGGRFNDVTTDPDGCVLCGTTSDAGEGKLYRLDRQGGLTTLIEEAGISNGMGFLASNSRLLHTNSQTRTISSYRYGATLEERQVWLDLSDRRSTPDGLVVDAEERVWSARFDGGGVYVYDAEAREVDFLRLPASKITSLTFGGPDLDLLFVTSAKGPAYLLRGAGRGRPALRSRISYPPV